MPLPEVWGCPPILKNFLSGGMGVGSRSQMNDYVRYAGCPAYAFAR